MQLLMAAVSLALAAAPAQVVTNRRIDASFNEVVPDRAWAVLALSDPDALDDKLAPLLMGRRTPFRATVLAKAWLSIIDGLDEHGTIAVVAMPVGKDATLPQRLAILVPTTDPTALMTLWSPETIEPGLYRAIIVGQESFVAFKSGYAVISPDLDILRRIIGSDRGLIDRLSPYLRQRSDAHDAFLWVDTAAVASGPLLDRYAGWLGRDFGLTREFLAPLRQFRLSAGLGADGLSVEGYIHRVKPSSAPDDANTTAPLLAGLPDEPVVLAMGAKTGGAADHLRAVFKPAVSALAYTRIVDPSRAADYERALEWLAKRADTVAISVSHVSREGDGALGVTVVIRARGGAAPVLDGVRSVADWLRTGPFLATGVNGAMEKLVHTPAAETVGGVPVDHWSVRFEGEQPEFYAAFKNAVGPEGFTVRVGVVDAKHVVATFGGGSARFSDAVRAVRSGRAPLLEDQTIATAHKHVAADRSMEAFFFPGRWAGLINTMSERMGRPFRYPDAPPSDAPVAVTAEALGTDATLVNLFIPIAVLKERIALPGPGDGSPGQ